MKARFKNNSGYQKDKFELFLEKKIPELPSSS